MIKFHPDLVQGSEEWLAARCGLITASEMDKILTPTLKTASNTHERAHLYELLSQRITRHVEPSYIGDAMLRGMEDEVYARDAYIENYAPVIDMGFITNDRWGFTIGCSPDGLVGDDGGIECKSRKQRLQVETIISNTMPDDFALQVQTNLLVTERKWWDFITFSGGLPMLTVRVFPDQVIMDAIVAAVAAFEARLAKKMEEYNDRIKSKARLVPTERRIIQEMFA